MGYLFDRLTRVNPDGTDTRLCDGYALYVVEKPAVRAAFDIFGDLDSKDVLPFVYLPFEKVCVEWQHGPGVKICVVMEPNKVLDEKNDEYDSIIMAACIETPDGKSRFSCAYIVRMIQDGRIPWHEQEPDNPKSEAAKALVKFDDDTWNIIIEHTLFSLAFINSPNLHAAEAVDMSKVNRKRRGTGKHQLANYTVIRPNSETKKWLRDNEKPPEGVAEHWVKAHPHTYLTGPGRTKAVVKLLAPFKRGNPEFGTREQRYRVTSAAPDQ